MRIGNLKKTANEFLAKYKSESPAAYAGAQQAIGGLLILDGFIGIDNPFGGKKRPGIFGTIIGIIVGIVFIFLPTIFGNLTGSNKMTASTTATVLSVSQNTQSSQNTNGSSSGSSCNASARYTVNGQTYSQNSSFGSSSTCGLTTGSTIDINYNPDQPGQWGYGVGTINSVLKVFPFVGVISILVGLVTFIIRLLSIIFGWKLLKEGKNLAKTLPAGTNLGTVIDQIKENFRQIVFSKGSVTPLTPPQPPATPMNPTPQQPTATTPSSTPPSNPPNTPPPAV